MGVSLIGSGGDYATIDLWEATLSGTFTEDMVGALKNEVFTPSGTLAFGGFTTAATGKLVLRAATAGETGGSSAKHTGLAGTGARITKTNGGGWGIFYTTDANVKHFIVKDLELYSNGAQNLAVFPNNTAFDYGVAENLLIYDIQYGVDFGKAASGATAEVINVAAWNISGNGPNGIIGVAAATDRVKAYHCTLVRQSTDADAGVTGIRYCLVKNCAVFHYGPTGGHADFLNAGTGSNYNASSDTSSPGANSLDNVVAADQFQSVGGTWDLHLKAGSSLEAAGTPIGSVTVDVDGDARDGTAPDIGFDEFAGVEFTGDGDFTLPNLIVAGEATFAWAGDGAFDLPALAAAGEGSTGIAGDGDFALPELTAAGTAHFGYIGDSSFTLPNFSVAGQGAHGIQGDGALTLPNLVVRGVEGAEGDSSGVLQRRIGGFGIGHG